MSFSSIHGGMLMAPVLGKSQANSHFHVESVCVKQSCRVQMTAFQGLSLASPIQQDIHVTPSKDQGTFWKLIPLFF